MSAFIKETLLLLTFIKETLHQMFHHRSTTVTLPLLQVSNGYTTVVAGE